MNLLLPEGGTRPAVYIADVKLLPAEQRKLTTARLLQKGIEWGRTKCDLWFTVTMDGTPQKPPDYTGRAGIPPFSEAGKLMVVRVPVNAGGGAHPSDDRLVAPREKGVALFKRLARGRYAVLGGSPEARSVSPPAWLAHPNGLACARFEDRRKVRRLIADDGSELRPAYLSCFAFQDPRAAVDLIAAGLARAGALGYRALRFCMPPADLAKVQSVLGPGVIQGSGGAVFATASAKRGALWNLNASEV